MASVTQPLRDEHRELLPHIESLCAAADSVKAAAPAAILEEVDEAIEFLAAHLIPHALAEDAALYPVVGETMGARQATATMSRDHVEVGRMTQELKTLRRALGDAPLTDFQARELRRLLYGLYAIVKLHFAKEEEIYLPLLDEKLSEAEAGLMFEAMEKEAGRAKAAAAAG